MLAFLGLNFGGSANLDDGNAASQLGQTFLQLLAIVIGIGVGDFGTNLSHAGSHVFLGAAAGHDGGLILGDDDLLGSAEHGHVDGVKLETQFVGHDLCAGQNGHILQHGLATVTEARSLDGAGLEGATDVVQDQGRQSLAVDVLGDDQQRLAGLHDQFGDVYDVLLGAQLAGGQQDVRFFEHCGLIFGVGHEVRGNVALVETHAFGEVQIQAETVVVLNGHNTILANLVQRLSDLLADFRIGCGNRCGGSDLILGLNVLGSCDELLDDSLGSLLDTTTQSDWVGTGGDVLQAFVHQGLCKHSCGGGAVSSNIVGLLGDFLDQFGTDALVRVVQVDFLGDGNAIVGDGRSAVGLVENHVAALRTEGDLNGVSELVEAREHSLTSFVVVCNDLCHCSSTYGYTVLFPLSKRRTYQPSAASYHSHSSSANWQISTLRPRVPNSMATVAL